MSQATLTIEQIRAIANGKPKKKKRPRKTKNDYLARFAETPVASSSTPGDRHEQRALFERHDSTSVTIRLPLAPTINCYRAIFQPKNGRARLITSAEGRAYCDAVAKCWQRHHKGWPPEPLTGRLRLLVSVSYFNASAIDLDNRIKPLQDALTECKVWLDDSQIDDLRVIRGPLVEKPGCMDVIIETIGE